MGFDKLAFLKLYRDDSRLDSEAMKKLLWLDSDYDVPHYPRGFRLPGDIKCPEHESCDRFIRFTEDKDLAAKTWRDFFHPATDGIYADFGGDWQRKDKTIARIDSCESLLHSMKEMVINHKLDVDSFFKAQESFNRCLERMRNGTMKIVGIDFAPFSLAFACFGEGGRVFMRGGMIWHASCLEWNLHT